MWTRLIRDYDVIALATSTRPTQHWLEQVKHSACCMVRVNVHQSYLALASMTDQRWMRTLRLH